MAKFGQFWGKIGEIWPILGKIGEIWPVLGKNWGNFANFGKNIYEVLPILGKKLMKFCQVVKILQNPTKLDEFLGKISQNLENFE